MFILASKDEFRFSLLSSHPLADLYLTVKLSFVIHKTFLELHSKTVSQHSAKQLKKMRRVFKKQKTDRNIKRAPDFSSIKVVNNVFSTTFGIFWTSG